MANHNVSDSCRAPLRHLSICLGLVLGAVGFDQISGAPRLVLFDINGFLQGIGFLVLAIGVYGIGEMLWTIEESRGKIDGITASEAANNSASTGSMLPMLTLGIPGSPTTAILLRGMVMSGLTPGPRLFLDEPEFVWGLIGSFYISNLAAVVINLAFIPVFIWMLRMPFSVLAPMIFGLSIVGGYAAMNDMFDIWLILIFGVGAFVLRRLDYPLAPAVLAIVLGPFAEPTLRQSLLLSSGDLSIFFTRPIAGPIAVAALILIFLPAVKLLRRARGKGNDKAA